MAISVRDISLMADDYKNELWYEELTKNQVYPEYGGRFMGFITPDPAAHDQQNVYAYFMHENYFPNNPDYTGVTLQTGTMNRGLSLSETSGASPNQNIGPSLGGEFSELKFSDYFYPRGLDQTPISRNRQVGNTITGDAQLGPIFYNGATGHAPDSYSLTLTPDPFPDRSRLYRREYAFTVAGNGDFFQKNSDNKVIFRTRDGTNNARIVTDIVRSGSGSSRLVAVVNYGVRGQFTEEEAARDEMTISFKVRPSDFNNTPLLGDPGLIFCPLGTAAGGPLLEGLGFQLNGNSLTYISLTSLGYVREIVKLNEPRYGDSTPPHTRAGTGDSFACRITVNKRHGYVEIQTLGLAGFYDQVVSDLFVRRYVSQAEMSALSGRKQWWIGTDTAFNTADYSLRWEVFDIKASARNISHVENTSGTNVGLIRNLPDKRAVRDLTAPRYSISVKEFREMSLSSRGGVLNPTASGDAVALPNQGLFGTIDEPLGRGTVFEMMYTMEGYFDTTHTEHIAIGVRGNVVNSSGTPALSGKGVVLGNVTGYTSSLPEGLPASRTNRCVIESFWEGGNCVYGGVGELTIPLVDGRLTYLRIVVDDVTESIFVHLAQKNNSLPDQVWGASQVFSGSNAGGAAFVEDTYYGNSESQSNWFIGTAVQSQRPWDMTIHAIRAYNYDKALILEEMEDWGIS